METNNQIDELTKQAKAKLSTPKPIDEDAIKAQAIAEYKLEQAKQAELNEIKKQNEELANQLKTLKEQEEEKLSAMELRLNEKLKQNSGNGTDNQKNVGIAQKINSMTPEEAKAFEEKAREDFMAARYDRL